MHSFLLIIFIIIIIDTIPRMELKALVICYFRVFTQYDQILSIRIKSFAAYVN